MSWEDDITWGAPPQKPEKPEKVQKAAKGEKHRTGERAVAMQLSPRYLYRRAFSELQLRDAIRGISLTPGTCINVITGGNIDQMSYLSYFVREHRIIDCYITTWCMAAEDARQVIEWLEYGKMKTCQIYVGEIFKSSYNAIFYQLRDYFDEHPEKGKISIFKCHAKIIAATTKDFAFAVQTSANMDTNPRTEQGCIQISEDSFKFYKDYLDGINSFE